MGNEAVIEEVRFEDSRVGGDCTFRKVDDFFDDKETPYCICVGKFPQEPINFMRHYMLSVKGSLVYLSLRQYFLLK